jgi:hypothetical protein
MGGSHLSRLGIISLLFLSIHRRGTLGASHAVIVEPSTSFLHTRVMQRSSGSAGDRI